MKRLSFKAEEIDNRLVTVEALEAAQKALELSMNQAINTSQVAKNTADVATATAKTASATAKTAEYAASTAQYTADTAKSTADAAKSTAATALSTAETARATADAAKAAADTAASTAKVAELTEVVGSHTTKIAEISTEIAAANKTIADNQLAIAKEVSDLSKDVVHVAKYTAEVGENGAKISQLQADMLALNSEVLGETGKVAINAANVAEASAAITVIQENVSTLTADVATATAEVATITAEVATNTANVAKNTADVATAAANITTIQSDVTKLTADVAANTAAVAQHTTDVAALTSSVATNTAEVAKATADVAQVAADITGLQSNMSSVMAKIGDENAGMMKDMADMAGELSDLAQELEDIVLENGLDGDGLKDNLERIEKLANDAQAHSEEVQKLATEGKGIAEDAKGKAEKAQGDADKAEGHAQQGISDAAAAQKSADDAQTSATNAATAASAAQARAEEAWTHADSAKQSAESALTSANSANEAAGEAKTSAIEAKTFATEAKEKATEAYSWASTAKDNANSALESATTASTAALDAKSLAEAADALSKKAEGDAAKAQSAATDAETHAKEIETNVKLIEEQVDIIDGLAKDAKNESEAAKKASVEAKEEAGKAKESASKAQEAAAGANKSAEEALTNANDALGHATKAETNATLAKGEADKATSEAAKAVGFAEDAQLAADKAEAAAMFAQLVADGKSSSFNSVEDPVEVYNNAIAQYLSNKTQEYLDAIPTMPKLGDIWYKPTGENNPDEVYQLISATYDFIEAIKDENENVITNLYLIFKTDAKEELGGNWNNIMEGAVTQGFVNALGITAQKIEVKDSSNNLLFKADASDAATNKVIIGGFGVKNNALHSGMIDSMNAVITGDNVTGVYVGTDGIRVGNKFKVTKDGTVYSSEFKLSQEEIDKLALKVKYILYAKNDSGTVPPENNWTTTLPEAEAGEYIWTKYVYQDTDEDDSNNQYSYQVYRQPENGTPGKDGQDGTNGKDGKDGSDGLTPYIKDGYWWLGDTNTGVMAEPISYSITKNLEFHNGSEQAENLQFIVQKQIGQNEREPNTDVIFRYKFADEPDYTGPIEVNSDGIFVLSRSLFLDKNRQDLTVSIGHWENGLGVDFVEDDVEIINYISKSGYAVILDNDVASLVYNSDGTAKLDGAQSVTATASLYENNELVNYSTSTHLYYEWTLDGLTGNVSSTRLAGNNDTITITAIDTDRDFGTATCIAVWEDAPQEHKAVTFKVNKNRQGIQGIQGIQGEKGATGEKGEKGDKGDKGDNGTSIGSVVEYYLATSLSAGVTINTSGWTTTVQNVDATKKYLWNYEVIKDSTGKVINSTDPCIIGAYGDKGSQGNTGKGISSITNYYLVSANPTGIVNTSGDWKTTPQKTDTTNKYLWNYEVIAYTDGTTTETNPCIIGTHGETGAAGKDGKDGSNGKDGTSITIKSIQYQAGTSGTTKPTSTWSNDPVTVGKGGYLWTKTTYSDNSEVFTAAYQGNDGTNGTSVGISKIEYTVTSSNSTPTSGWSTTYPTTIGTGKYLWTKTTYTDNKAVYTSSYQGINGIDGQDGKDGIDGTNGKDGADGKDGNNGIDATSYWLSTSSYIHRGPLQENDIVITVYKKTGNEAETQDTSATIYVNGVSKGTGSITISKNTIASTYKNTDLTIVAKHNNVEFDREIIERAVNTYVLALSNDSSTIKTGETATSNAIVYMDGVDVSSGSSPLETVTFKWTAVGSTSSLSSTSNISINASSISGTKTYNCQATVNGTVLNKQFTVTKVSDGTNGISPEIINGYWYIGTTNTGIKAEGVDGAPGTNGTNGSNGLTPYISGGYWWIGTTNTGIKAEGVDGTNGTSAGNLYKLENTGNAPSKPTSLSDSAWTKAPQEPTAKKNYCWVSAYTINANGTFTAETPILHASYEGMISFLSDEGLKLIAKDSSTGEYHVKTDHISGALSDKVTVGGFTVNNSYIASDPKITVLANENYDGVYIGTDGISLGKGNFVVRSNGDVTIAGNVTIGKVDTRLSELENDTSAAWDQANSAQNAAKTAQSTANSASTKADNAQSTADSASSKANANAQSIVTINGTINAIQGNFETLDAKVANLGNASAKSIRVGTAEKWKFVADSTSNEVSIGGFTANTNSLYSSGYISSYSSTPSANGIYVGTDGIKLGTNFSVSNAGSITAKRGTIGGLNLSNSSISSTNGNFSVSSAGSITAKSGTIGGFSLGSSNIHSDGYITSYSSTPSSDGVYIGTEGIKLGTKFSVSKAGGLTANNGKIGGFDISPESIQVGSGTTIYGLFPTVYSDSCFKLDNNNVLYGNGFIRAKTMYLAGESNNYTDYRVGFDSGSLKIGKSNHGGAERDFIGLTTIDPWELSGMVFNTYTDKPIKISYLDVAVSADSTKTISKTSSYGFKLASSDTIISVQITPKNDISTTNSKFSYVTWDSSNVYIHNNENVQITYTVIVFAVKADSTTL